MYKRQGLEYAKEGNHLHEISGAIEKKAKSYGCSVIRDFVGHGAVSYTHLDVYKRQGLGTAIISTNKGIITDKEARKLNVGGEVLAFIW